MRNICSQVFLHSSIPANDSKMSDITSKRTTALNQLLEQFDRRPSVPLKDRCQVEFLHTTITEQEIVNATIASGNATKASELATQDGMILGGNLKPWMSSLAGENRGDGPDLATMEASDASSGRMPLPTFKKKKVAFTQVDSAEPPQFTIELSKDKLKGRYSNTTTSVLDGSSSPRTSRFPGQRSDAPRRKPAPLLLNRPTSHSGKWKVHADAHRDSGIWTPIDDEPDMASIISMDVQKAPRICPLPYKPMKSIPLKPRGLLRPAPLRIRKGVRFDSAKSPACLPLKSPAFLRKKVRFDNVKSPATTTFRTPPTPFSSSQFMVLSPGRSRGVRFASMKSPAASKFKTPPTPYYQSKFSMPVSSSAKRNVRFLNMKSPAASRFKIPPTPFYQDTFEATISEKGVRFADVISPVSMNFKNPPTPFYQDTFETSTPEKAVHFTDVMSPVSSNFKNPPTPYHNTSFRESVSPPEHSPVTPRAMHMTIPDIESNSPLWSLLSRETVEAKEHDTQCTSSAGKKDLEEAQIVYPPRTTSLQHRRNASLPKNVHSTGDSDAETLPATTFDETAVGESTLRWLGMLPKTSYRVNDQTNQTDRHQILGTYFHRPRPSF